MNWISYLLAIGAGAINPIQTGANAQLNKSLATPVWTALSIYLSGFCAMLLIQAFVRETLPSARLAAVPWWAWTGGVVSVGSTIAGLAFAQKMGSGSFTGLSITASLITSIVLDHFGAVGFKVHPVSVLRLLGGGLMITGLWLVAKF